MYGRTSSWLGWFGLLTIATALPACLAAPPARRDAAAPLDAGRRQSPDATDDVIPHEVLPGEPPSPGNFPSGHPDHYWLDRIGKGAAQLRRVCERGRDDLVTRQLCAPDVIADSLRTLHARLGLTPGTFNLSIGTHSSGLTSRTTSVINPRSFLSTPLSNDFDLPNMVVTAFSRGDQLVELMAYDKTHRRLNLYLLAYETACGRESGDTSTGCTAYDLLSGATETEWRNVTLYDEGDLVDTPLDCLSCHRPEESPGETRILMRDFESPWFHWLPDEGEVGGCGDLTGMPRPAVHPPANLRDEFRRIFPGGYGGHDLAATESSLGHNLHSLANIVAVKSDRQQNVPALVMPSREVLDEWRCDDKRATYNEYRRGSLEAVGVPIPYDRDDVLDRRRAARALADRDAFLRDSGHTSPFALLTSLISDDAQKATGALTAEGSAPALLRQACRRCHDDRAPPGSVRARFHVDRIDAAAATAALARLALDANAPHAMPPRRAAALTPTARARLVEHFGTLAR